MSFKGQLKPYEDECKCVKKAIEKEDKQWHVRIRYFMDPKDPSGIAVSLARKN